MTKKVYDLDDVLRAIHNAVVEAQKLTEQQHQRQIKRYFNQDGTPICQKIHIPNTNPDSSEDWEEIDVPLMVLAPPSAIKIKKMMVDFKVRLGGFIPEKAKEGAFHATQQDRSSHPGPLQVDLGNGFFSKESSLANIKVIFEGADPPESILKINDELIKVFP